MAQQTFATRLQAIVRSPMRLIRKVRLDETGLMSLAGIVRTFDKRATSKDFEPFDTLEVEVARALVAVLCDHDQPGLPELDVVSVAAELERRVIAMPKGRSQEMRRLLVAIEYLPVQLGPRRARFTELAEDERITYLRRWDSVVSPQRHRRFLAVKRLVMTACWSDPDRIAATSGATPQGDA